MRGYSKALNRYAVFVACCTFLLIFAGGLVTSTQSGLSVPDWPNTYGHFMFAFPLDQMVGGIFYEHSHRMIASVVGMLTVILAFWIFKRDERKWVQIMGFCALGAVITQGVLGGITVLFLLPTWISVSHATLAQTFFVIVSSLALFTTKWWREEQPMLDDTSTRFPLRRLAIITSIAVYLQLIMGALMRHSSAGLAVPDFPLAYEQLFPSLSNENISYYNRHLEVLGLRIFADDPISPSQIIIHMLHRIWAGVVFILVLLTVIKLRTFAPQNKRLSFFSYALLILILVQLSLGAFTVISRKAVDVTTLHVATGALLLVVSMLTTLHTYKVFRYSPKNYQAPIIATEVLA